MLRPVMTRLTLALAALTLLACGDPDPDPVAEPSEEPAAPAEPEADAVEDTPSTPPAEAAIEAYRAGQTAYEEGDVDAYAEGYAVRLDCFVRRENVERNAVQSTHSTRISLNRGAGPSEVYRFRSLALTVESEAPNQVVLHDWGWQGRGGGAEGTTFYANRVTLSRQGEVWRITSETPLGTGCGTVPPREAAPAVWTALQDAYQAMVTRCTGEGHPGLGSGDCACEAGIPTADAYCRGRVGCDAAPAECDATRLSECVDGDDGAAVTAFCSPGAAEDA